MDNYKLSKNYLFNLSYQIFSMLAPLITTPYVSRVLQADGVGMYSYTYTIATIFVSIAQLGTVSYGVREIAYHKDKLRERTIIFWNVFIFRCITVLSSTIFYLIIFCRGPYKEVFEVQTLCIIGVACDISWFYQGIEEFKTIAVRDFLSKICSIFAVFLLVRSKDDVSLYAFILAIAIIVGRILNWISLPKYITKVGPKSLNPFHQINVIITLFIPQMANQLYTAIDKSMIGFLTADTFENGYYAQSDRIIKLCTAVLTSIVTVVGPRIAQAYAKNRVGEIKSYARQTIKFIWMLGLPMSFGLAGIIDHIVPWFLGPGYDTVETLIYIFTPQICLIGLTTMFGMFLVNTGQQKKYTIGVVTGVCINIILNLVLIPKMFSIGASVASVFAECVIALIELYCLRELIPCKKIARYSYKYFAASVIMFSVLIFVKKFLSTQLIDTVILVVIGFAVYLVSLIIMKDQLLAFIIKFIKDRLHN